MKLGLTPEQHAQRRNWIGGSDAGAIVAGGDEWQHLWLIKTGRLLPDDLSDVLAVQMGLFTEPLNIHWYERTTGRAVERRGQQARHPTIPHLGCTLDGLTRTSGGDLATFQAKHVGRAGEQLVLRYTAQCTHEALCLGCDWFVMSTFVGNSKWELTEQEVDPFFAQDYVQKCAEFWRYVERDESPPDAVALPVPPPKRLRTVLLDDLSVADWPNWGGEMVRHFGSFANTLSAHQAHEIAKRNIKDLMPDDVGLITRGLIKAARYKAGAVRISLSKEKGDGC
jgi:hypothetical protein